MTRWRRKVVACLDVETVALTAVRPAASTRGSARNDSRQEVRETIRARSFEKRFARGVSRNDSRGEFRETIRARRVRAMGCVADGDLGRGWVGLGVERAAESTTDPP